MTSLEITAMGAGGLLIAAYLLYKNGVTPSTVVNNTQNQPMLISNILGSNAPVGAGGSNVSLQVAGDTVIAIGNQNPINSGVNMLMPLFGYVGYSGKMG